jgi:hypothetical protein
MGIATGVATVLAGEVVQAMADGVLDGTELGRLIKRGIMTLRMSGVSQEELDLIKIVSQKYEYDTLNFKDGDMVIYVPVELSSKLKIKV